jgi:uncharacterized protein (TIGR01777 family)
MRILITGGTGFIGSHLITSLKATGHECIVLTRRASTRFDADAQVQAVQWPGPPEEIPAAAIAGIDAVINLAGESLGGGRWTKARKDRFFASRLGTTNALTDAIASMEPRPQVMISASAVGYYGPHGDEKITEAGPPGEDFLSVLCSEWEMAAKAAIPLGMRLVILRIGLVLGPGGGVLPRLMLPFKFFVGGPIGSGQQVMSWIHLDDLIGLILFALDHAEVSGPVNATAPNPVTNREFATILGRVMHRPSFFRVPAFVLRLALGEMADTAVTGQRVVPKRALEYGYQFQHAELNEALRDVLEE